MVNSVIYAYLKQHLSTYTLEDLRRKILDSGYTQLDIDEAIKKLKDESSERLSQSHHSSDKKISPGQLPSDELTNLSPLFKISGIAGILVIFIFPLLIITRDFFKDILIIFFLFLSILFFLGFIYLGKKYNRMLITTASWFFILGFLAFFLLYLSLRVYPSFSPVSFVSLETFFGDPLGTLLGLGTLLLGIVLGFMGLFIFFGIILGVGILQMRHEVRFAEVTGILTLVGFSTTLLLVGFFILPLAFIFQSILLFKESYR